MNEVYPLVPLSDVLTERQEVPSADALIKGEICVIEKIGFNDGKIQLRTNSTTKTNMILIQPGDLVVSGINAAKGAIAIFDQKNTRPIAATIHYSSYIINKQKADIKYLWWLLRSHKFKELLLEYSPGGIKTELKAKRFLPIPIPLPPLEEQRRIVVRVEELVGKIEEVRSLRNEIIKDSHRVLLSAYYKLIEGAEYLPMKFVAPLQRRTVKIELSKNYPELGIRSFGKGAFHKPALSGSEVGTKKLFRIEANDLLFQIVFAWEGAVAVAQSKDNGRFGSHRFLTCVPQPGIATSSFLCFHFLTEKGLEDLGKASPGGAGRNRTLGLKALENIQVPIPLFEKQLWFDELQTKIDTMKPLREEAIKELDAILPSILDKAFKGEL
jgi:type I restriction enzyme S subunit